LIEKIRDSFSGHLFFPSFGMRKLYEKVFVEQRTNNEARAPEEKSKQNQPREIWLSPVSPLSSAQRDKTKSPLRLLPRALRAREK
jgi:hypothetical protein